MVRLLDACVHALRKQGKTKMYIDAVKGGEAGFQSIGTYNPSFGEDSLFVDHWQGSNNGRGTEMCGRLCDQGDDAHCLCHWTAA